MIANFHTHTSFCDGKNTPEEIIKAAINKGFSAIGFSGHGYTDFDLRYCMKNTDEYIKEITQLKEKYKVISFHNYAKNVFCGDRYYIVFENGSHFDAVLIEPDTAFLDALTKYINK